MPADVEDDQAAIDEREKECVVYIGTTLEPGFCHTCLPVAASNAVTTPVMPIEYSLPLANTGVDFGPGPWWPRRSAW